MRTYPRDLYEVLKLPHHQVSQEEIKQAYWDRRLEIDPLGLGEPHDQLKPLGEAYTVLSDTYERRLYDEFLAGKPAAPKVPGATFRRKAGAPPPQPAAAAAGQPDQPVAAPYAPPVANIRPLEPAAYIRWRLGIAETRTRIFTAIAALVILPALVATVAFGPLLAEMLAAAVITGVLYVVVRSWTSMRLLLQGGMVLAAAAVAAESVLVLTTWPLVPEVIAGIVIGFLVLRLRLYMIIVYIVQLFL